VEGPGEASSSASNASGGGPQEEAFPRIQSLSKDDLEAELKQVKKDAKQRRANILDRLTSARDELDLDACRTLVLDATRDELADHISRYVAENRRDLVAALENWWDKYRTTLRDIEAERDDAREQLEGFLEELGYV
jgi:type I restriction enzyme M protein